MSVPAATPEQAAEIIRGFLPPLGMTSIADDPTKPAGAKRLHEALSVLEAQHRDAIRLLNRVVQADHDDAKMGHPNPGDSCIAACIGLEVMPWLDEQSSLDRVAGDDSP